MNKTVFNQNIGIVPAVCLSGSSVVSIFAVSVIIIAIIIIIIGSSGIL